MVSSHIFRFGLFEADPDGNTLTRNGVRVKIQDQPFRVLIALLKRPGEIVTRDELRQQLWPEGTYVDFDGSLNAVLKKLRAAIDDDSDNPRFIETVPRRGYRFIAPVSVNGAKSEPITVFSPVAELPKPAVEKAEVSSPPPSHGPSVHLIYVVVAVVACASIGAAWLVWHRHHSAPPAGPITPAAVAVRKSIAVLGFRNASSRPNDEWLGTALSEMLSTELATGEKLRLVPGEDVANLRRSSPWSATDTLGQPTTSRVGTALNSDYLVLGSYTTIGDSVETRVRFDVRLQDAKSGEILTETSDTASTQDLFQLASRAGAKLTARLGVPSLRDTEQATAMAALSSNADAAKFYSLGLVKLREHDYLAARDFFDQATKADPEFPLAFSMLSRADISLGHDDQAKVEAKRAFDVAGNLPRMQRMEIDASSYRANGERAKAAEIYRVLFNLFPDNLDYGLELVHLQFQSNQPAEGLETVRRLRQLPPPERDDPGIDLEEAFVVSPTDLERGEKLFHSAAAKAQSQGKRLTYAKAEQTLCYFNRKYLQSPPECREAYEAFLSAGNRDDAASCLQLMAEAQRKTGHEREAIPLYEQALAMFKSIGDRERTGVALNNLSRVLEDEGRWADAEKNYREARKNFEAVKDTRNTSAASVNVADILVLRGRLREAADLYRQDLETAEAGNGVPHYYTHLQHAALLLIEGDLKEAGAEVKPEIV
ncbi:MAG: tetratricopeptide repeat protein, partial [Acidobacteriaceae bacterium]|nr:tetratricopeptide repeat protein [Acidobacteriaceae bacterium]